MGKKNRSRRRKNGNDSDDEDRSNGGADYLSESHTIDGFGSQGDTATLDSIPDDADWGIHDEDDEHYHKKHISEENAAQALEATQQKLAEILGSTVPEFAGEKRSAKREAMLKTWFKSLTHYATMPPYDIVERWREDLVKACSQYALLRGSPAEQYAGCRVLEAMAVLIGDHDLYEDLAKRLTRAIQSTHKATPVRVSALRALGMLVFCGIEDDVITESVLDVCEEIVKGEYRGQSTPPALRAAAWQVWTLLATTIHELYVSGKTNESIGRGLVLLPFVAECLEHEDNVLKEAAGQAMAYIHDCRLRLGVDDDEVENTTDAKYALGSWEGTEWEGDVDEITQTVYDLANASGHYMSKKAKKEQRSVFRDYLGLLQDNESPEAVVAFRGGTLELTSFGDVVALEFVKRCLQGGFQAQLLTNPTLQAIFGCDGAALGSSSGYSQLEKRLLLSKTSEAAKLKDQDRHKGRKKRQNIKNHFLTGDGEDI